MPSPQKILINMLTAGWVLISVLTACKHERHVAEESRQDNNISEQLINVNKTMVRTEDELIDDFIRRYGWNMNKTGTGLRYMIYLGGEGPAATQGMKATITCSVVLLNGDTCYPALTRSFIIGKETVESGIDEGIRFMHAGDKAKFILPSHLAFGLPGDQKSIPQKATLVYDVHLIDLVNIK